MRLDRLTARTPVEEGIAKGREMLSVLCIDCTEEQQKQINEYFEQRIPLVELSFAPFKQAITRAVDKIKQYRNKPQPGAEQEPVQSNDDLDALIQSFNKLATSNSTKTPVQSFEQKHLTLKKNIIANLGTNANVVERLETLKQMGHDDPRTTTEIIAVMGVVSTLHKGNNGATIAVQLLQSTIDLLKAKQMEKSGVDNNRAAELNAMWVDPKQSQLIAQFLKTGVTVAPAKPESEVFVSDFTQFVEKFNTKFSKELGSHSGSVVAGTQDDLEKLSNLIKQAGGSWSSNDYGSAQEFLNKAVQVINTLGNPQYLANLFDNEAAIKHVAQSAVSIGELLTNLAEAAKTAAASSKTESRVMKGRKLSEGQVYLLLKKLSNKCLVESAYDFSKSLAKKWADQGYPQDPNDVAKFLLGEGVNPRALLLVYAEMKLPMPK